MALTLRRRTSQLTFVLLAVIAALFSGLALADDADNNRTVRYSPWNIPEPVRYGVPLRIDSVGWGGFESEFDPSSNTFYQRLTGSKGDIQTLVSTSDKPIRGAPVYENDFVYIALPDRRPPPAALRWWGWRKEGETDWFLVATSKDKRAKFKFTSTICVRLNNCYFLQSCAGSFCSIVVPYRENEVIYIKLGDKSSKENLDIMFRPVINAISMPTDA